MMKNKMFPLCEDRRQIRSGANHGKRLRSAMRKIVYMVCVTWLVFSAMPGKTAYAACAQPLYQADPTELQRWTHYGDIDLTAEGNIRAQKFGPKRLWSARSEKKINLTGQVGDFLVVKALVRGDGLVVGQHYYDTAHLKATIATRSGREAGQATFMSGSFPWGYRFMIAERPADATDVTLSLLNLASQGSMMVQSLSVYLCSASEIASFDYPVSWRDAISGQPPVEARVNLKSVIWRPLNKDLMGFDAAFHTLRYPPARDLLALPLVRDLPFSLLRFPSGIAANFYHWEYDGFDPNDLQAFPQMDSPGLRNAYRMRGKGGIPLGMKDTMEWANRSGVKIGLVLNVVTAKDIQETIGLVKEAKRFGAHVAFVELGNELYLKVEGGKRISGSKEYVETVKPVIAALRKQYPDIRIGVPFSHEDWDWNQAVARAGLDFDAIILHPYINSSSVATTAEDRVLIEYAAQGLKEIFQRITREYPGKPIWATEWNFEDRPLHRLTQESIGAIYAANVFATMLETPSLEAANYFTLFGKPIGVIEVRGDNSANVSYRTPPAYDLWKGLAHIVQNSNDVGVVPVALLGSSKTSGVSGKDFRLFAFRRGSELNYFIINNTVNPLRLTFDGTRQKWNGTQGGAIRLGDTSTLANVTGDRMTNDVLEVQPMSATWIGPVSSDMR